MKIKESISKYGREIVVGPVFGLIFRLISLVIVLYLPVSGDDLDRVSIVGRVSDVRGGLVVDALVIARRLETGVEQTTKSDGRGEYRLLRLSPGFYELRAEATGFQTVLVPGFNGLAGERVRYDFVLGPGRIAVEVTVGPEGGVIRGGKIRDEAIRVDVTRTVVGATLGRGVLEGLPVESRNPLDLVLTLSGATLPGLSDMDLAEGDRRVSYRATPEESGLFSLQGGTPFSNNLTIEGLDNNDDRAARERFVPSLAGVEEVQVITNQFSAEYGRAAGGRVNLRLRGGTESLHGEIFHYYRDARMNANGYFRNADPRRGARIPFFSANPGATIGGSPGFLRRWKGRFFTAFEYEYLDDRATIAALVPAVQNPRFPLPAPNGKILDGEVGLYDLSLRTPRENQTWQSREDFEPGGGHRLSTFLTLGRSVDRRGFPGGRRMIETMRRTGRDNISAAFTDQAVLSESVFNSLRFQWSRLSPTDSPLHSNTGSKRISAVAAPVVLIGIEDPRQLSGTDDDRSGTLVAGSSTLNGLDRREDRWQIQESMTVSRGLHTITFGGDLHAISSRFRDLSDATGTFSFDSVADFMANQPSRFVQRFRTESAISNHYQGIFWQDDWRIGQGLNLSFGLRWDNESVIADRNNFGPRLAMAWDPSGSGRSLLRAGYGTFFNRAMLRTIDDFKLTSQKLLLDTNNGLARGLLTGLDFPRALRLEDAGVAEATVAEGGFQRRLQSGFRLPESSQWSIGFERELGGWGRLEIGHVSHRGLHLWRESNINAARLPPGFSSWTDYLLSLKLSNAPDPSTGQRLYPGQADQIRFSTSVRPSETVRENGVTTITYGLNSVSTSNSTNGIRTALAVLRPLRPSTELTQVEELQSRGNSLYNGLSIGLNLKSGSRGSLRLGYTRSRSIDDGIVNTSSPLVAGDFRRERSLSLLDSRHRLVISGSWRLPAWRALLHLTTGWTVGGILQLTSARPFNIGIAGNDRNLDDVGNDRPNFSGDPARIGWRRPGEALAPEILDRFSLPTIGTAGDLARNAGRGPAIHTLNLRASRSFRVGSLTKAREKMAIQLQIEAFNPLNSTVFSFGAEYVDFTPGRTERFLTPTRTIKPRTLRIGIRFNY